MDFIIHVLAMLAIKDSGEYWEGCRGNKWSKSKYSREEAFLAAESLVNCRGCEDCEDCVDCANCKDCKGCSNCFYCEACWRCDLCGFCINQEFITNQKYKEKPRVNLVIVKAR